MQEIDFESDKKDFMNDKKRNKWIFIGLGVIGLIVIIFFLLFRFFTPFGAIVSYQFNSILDRDKVSKIKGAQETSSFNPTQTGVLQIPQQIIKQSVVTFNLKLITKPIEGVWVNLKFKGNPKEIKIGVRGSEKESYQYQPLYNEILNSLSWNQTTSGDTTFWQREKKYKDISELASKPPVSDDVKVASYFFNLSDIVTKESVPSSQSNLKFEKALRGSHKLFIKVDKMPFFLNIEKQDANVYKGEDSLIIQMFKDDNKVFEKEIPDDGITAVNSLKMPTQSEKIKIDNIPFGVYKVILSDKSEGADVRITKIETNQSTLVIGAHLWLYDTQPTTLWTNSKIINIPIVNTSNTQIIKLDDKAVLDISKPDRRYEFDLKSIEINKNQEVNKIFLEKGLLIIDGDGYFAFSESSFFNPEPIKTVGLSAVSDISKIDYIIANYQQVKKEGEWYTAHAYFDPKDIKINGDKLYFSLESPRLDSYLGEIVIDSLEVTVKKPGWFSKPIAQKEEAKPAAEKEGEKNIFSRAYAWVGEKATAVKNAVGGVLTNAWGTVRGFFNELVGMLPGQKAVKPTPVTILFDSTPTPTLEPSATDSPSATPPSTDNIGLLVRVLNGGAEKGAAGSVAAMLKDNGFTNVRAENADSTTYTGVTIQYRKEDISVADKIATILKTDFGTVTKTSTDSSTAETVVIIGKK